MTRPYLWIAAVGLGLVACNTTKSTCEHARSVFAEMSQVQFEEALTVIAPEERDQFKTRYAPLLVKADALFIQECEVLGREDLACIAQIDKLRAVADELRGKVQACNEHAEPGDRSCQEQAEAEANAKTGACSKRLLDFGDALYKKIKKNRRTRRQAAAYRRDGLTGSETEGGG